MPAKNFKTCCRLAFISLQEHKINFVEGEVESGFKDILQSEGLGLLKAVKFYSIRDNYAKSVSYSFLHLSLQETLAAHHITSLSDVSQIDLLNKRSVDNNYFNMWMMYVCWINQWPVFCF